MCDFTVEFLKCAKFHGNGRFSRKKANFTENVTAVKSWIRLVHSQYATYWSIEASCSVGAADVWYRQLTAFRWQNSTFRKRYSKIGLRCSVRILRASLAQIDTEMAEKYGKLGKAAKFRSIYDPVPASGLWSRSRSKVNQFIHVPTSIDMQHFIQIHARVFE